MRCCLNVSDIAAFSSLSSIGGDGAPQITVYDGARCRYVKFGLVKDSDLRFDGWDIAVTAKMDFYENDEEYEHLCLSVEGRKTDA